MPAQALHEPLSDAHQHVASSDAKAALRSELPSWGNASRIWVLMVKACAELQGCDQIPSSRSD